MLLKQSTAFSLVVGPFVDETDGTTRITDLTLTTSDLAVVKNGTAGNPASITSQAHIADGYYGVTLPSSVPDTLGHLEVLASASGALPVPARIYLVVPATTWDSLVAGTDYLPADAIQVEGSDATTVIDARIAAGITSLATATNVTDAQTAIIDHGDSDWASTPAAASGTAQGGASASITLASDASSVDNFYVGQSIYLTGGTGAGQDRICVNYNGTTKVATIGEAWAVNPDDTTTYDVGPGRTYASSLASSIVTSIRANLSTYDHTSDRVIVGEMDSSVVDTIMTTVIDEDYSAAGGTLTLGQFVYEVIQGLQNGTLSDNDRIVKKRDGATTAYTLTVDDASAPTAQSRSA